jgi:hypothetical protein
MRQVVLVLALLGLAAPADARPVRSVDPVSWWDVVWSWVAEVLSPEKDDGRGTVTGDG